RKVVRGVREGALLAALTLAGCGGGSLHGPLPDGGSDGSPPDGGSEGPPPDAGSEGPQPLPPVQFTVGARVPLADSGLGERACSGQLAVADMNKALATVNAARKGAWRKPVTFHLEERDVWGNEQMAHDAMNELGALDAKFVVSEASQSSIGANRWNYEQAAA